MTISDKPLETPGLQSIFWEKRRTKSNRIDIDRLLVFEQERKVGRLALHQNQVDLRMRNAASLDHVFDRRAFREKASDGRFTSPFEKKTEIAVKAQCDLEFP
jgi:hypothetical protein